ncbi:DUF1128 domain-containing protein [Bacillus taeanensis]|uniref:UPF0435 protein DS031_00190 n=1 Tax=Bacillus taeanensis TaxID=273032 RepID=A0A366Y4S9_9BACI|nr:DUF1128 domain-containing protein [Bacillus taeanensis]RBW71211.1 DUF1128 domain-containing protein [Bacillus taeanensis]
MDLNKPSVENAAFMVEEIQKKLRVVNMGVIKSTHFREEQYEELKDVYDYVMKKESFSVNEMDGILEELKQLRNA